MASLPTFVEESALWEQGFRCIAGIDEAGRGPLAGPVVAAAVVLFPCPEGGWVARIRDSKLLAAAQRDELAALLREHAYGVGVGVVSHEEIDGQGIAHAWRRAMALAVQALPMAPDFLLVDGRERLETSIGQRPVIHGDRWVTSIAAASIIAKVHRDQIMAELGAQYPGWGFCRNKGYATRRHFEALRQLGPSAVHRRSFRPVGLAAAETGGV